MSKTRHFAEFPAGVGYMDPRVLVGCDCNQDTLCDLHFNSLEWWCLAEKEHEAFGDVGMLPLNCVGRGWEDR
jgi:hypothetical protein